MAPERVVLGAVLRIRRAVDLDFPFGAGAPYGIVKYLPVRDVRLKQGEAEAGVPKLVVAGAVRSVRPSVDLNLGVVTRPPDCRECAGGRSRRRRAVTSRRASVHGVVPRAGDGPEPEIERSPARIDGLIPALGVAHRGIRSRFEDLVRRNLQPRTASLRDEGVVLPDILRAVIRAVHRQIDAGRHEQENEAIRGVRRKLPRGLRRVDDRQRRGRIERDGRRYVRLDDGRADADRRDAVLYERGLLAIRSIGAGHILPQTNEVLLVLVARRRVPWSVVVWNDLNRLEHEAAVVC